jgi:hypothetical protein
LALSLLVLAALGLVVSELMGGMRAWGSGYGQAGSHHGG